MNSIQNRDFKGAGNTLHRDRIVSQSRLLHDITITIITVEVLRFLSLSTSYHRDFRDFEIREQMNLASRTSCTVRYLRDLPTLTL